MGRDPFRRPEAVEEAADGDWVVRRLTGAASGKTYRCPGCDQVIPARVPHVVVWPAEPSWTASSGLEERRHWHTSCWQRRR